MKNKEPHKQKQIRRKKNITAKARLSLTNTQPSGAEEERGAPKPSKTPETKGRKTGDHRKDGSMVVRSTELIAPPSRKVGEKERSLKTKREKDRGINQHL
jgi:hypothetical protein